RYIELNPVRAINMAEQPSEYTWSSFRCNALGIHDTLITEHPLYMRLGNIPEIRQKNYQALFKQSVPDKTIAEIREATNKAWVLGSDYFVDQITEMLDRQALPKERGGDRRSEDFNKINRV
ncbi:MAG: transposase, partial [Gammaproteobacteria bacterium]|nr:transposase [Gammaproteobacteria bacterium]